MKADKLLFIVLYTLSWLGIHDVSYAQKGLIMGNVYSERGLVKNVNVQIKQSSVGTNTDSTGKFQFRVVPGFHTIIFSHVEFKTLTNDIQVNAGDTVRLSVYMSENIRILDQINIISDQGAAVRNQAGVYNVEPRSAQVIPGAFTDFSNVLKTLPGVSSNSELSSQFTVRGGNFDENLVYVNDFEIYRPQLIRSGKQEGLSFVNPDLVRDVTFSSGGWQAKYGDKLSSSLNVKYKQPESREGALQAGLLGGKAYYGDSFRDNNINLITGVRYNRANYLFNTFEVKGQYFPAFTDFQSYLTINPAQSEENAQNTEIGLLLAHADNNYLFKPESRTTHFGTQQQNLELEVDFDGNEQLNYNTTQGGIKLSHRFNSRLKSRVLVSGVYSREREYFDVEARYRLCDVQLNPNNTNSNECISVLGTGTNYRHARNRLNVKVFNINSRFWYAFNDLNTLEWGIGFKREFIDDFIEEYSFKDSAQYINFDDRIFNQLNLISNRYTGYLQNTTNLNNHHLTYGVRLHHWNVNHQWLISPRFQYSYAPAWEKDVILRASTGLYQQPPFYKELRDRSGRLNKNVKAQSSFHGIAGFDYRFEFLDRPFTLMTEVYYKYIDHVNPYDVENLRVNYFAKNNAKAYAIGFDARINGEFVEGAESWFSLGLLSTREDIEGDNRGYIRRPSDQRINLGIFFQDHLPNDPSLKTYLNLVFGSGLPFGPPGNEQYRNVFNGGAYNRVDLGMSKHIKFNNDEEEGEKHFISSLWLGLEVLNLLGANNTVSYNWVEDVNNNKFAVPNGLSARFLNINIVANY